MTMTATPIQTVLSRGTLRRVRCRSVSSYLFMLTCNRLAKRTNPDYSQSLPIPTHIFAIITRCKNYSNDEDIYSCSAAPNKTEVLSFLIPNFKQLPCQVSWLNDKESSKFETRWELAITNIMHLTCNDNRDIESATFVHPSGYHNRYRCSLRWSE